MPNRRPPRAAFVRSDGSATAHELAIRRLLAGDVRIHRYGFTQAVDALVDNLGCEGDCRVRRRFVPDAYRIDHEKQTIDLFEVEVTHRVPDAKMRQLADWWEAWDGEGEHDWLPRLFLVDRFGTIGTEINLRAVLHSS